MKQNNLTNYKNYKPLLNVYIELLKSQNDIFYSIFVNPTITHLYFILIYVYFETN